MGRLRWRVSPTGSSFSRTDPTFPSVLTSPERLPTRPSRDFRLLEREFKLSQSTCGYLDLLGSEDLVRGLTFRLLVPSPSIANEQERNRTTISSNVNDRTLHEVYLAPFLRSIQADVASGEFSSQINANSLLPLLTRRLASFFHSHVLLQPNQRILGLPE